jgi:hypothetical protein
MRSSEIPEERMVGAVRFELCQAIAGIHPNSSISQEIFGFASFNKLLGMSQAERK